MTPIFDAFPKRPLGIIRTGVTTPLLPYLLGFAFIMGAALIGLWQAPGIFRDLAVAAAPVVDETADIRNGRCNVTRGILAECEAEVVYLLNGETVSQTLTYVFFDPTPGDYSVGVVRSQSDPSLVTLDLGIDTLWNRLIVSGLAIAILAGIGLALLLDGLRKSRTHRDVRRPATQRPVRVTIDNMTKVLGGHIVAYSFVSQEGRKRRAKVRFGKDEYPFMLPGGDGASALAILPDNAQHAILLDEELRRLDLQDTERATIIAARESAFAPA